MSFPVMIDPVVREVLHLWYSQLCAGTQSRVVNKREHPNGKQILRSLQQKVYFGMSKLHFLVFEHPTKPPYSWPSNHKAATGISSTHLLCMASVCCSLALMLCSLM